MTSKICNDTIAAIASPPGSGAIGIVRWSGPAAREILKKILVEGGPDQMEPRRLYLKGIRGFPDGPVLDEAIVFWMEGPHSYTGEDVVEVQAHGGYRLLEEILETVIQAGARIAEPGEFTRRAFLNGRLDLAQAEAVADLITASSREAARLAQRQLSGSLSRYVSRFREGLIRLRSQLEAVIDFPEEEDITSLPYEGISLEVGGLIQEIKVLLETYREGRAYREGIRVAIVGKPNVGKSSLLNALLKEDRAIVHPTPGTTRDLIEETLDLNGLPVRFVDTAGIRSGIEPIEEEGIRRARERIARSDLVLALFDSSRLWEREDDDVLEAVAGRDTFYLLNKSDLPAILAVDELGIKIGNQLIFKMSAMTGTGVDNLKESIFSHFVHRDVTTEVVVTNVRHKVALERGLEALQRVLEGIQSKISPEFLADDLLIASNYLAEITGEITNDQILGEIFSKFCIGK